MRTLLTVILAVALTGCSGLASLPRDVDGTLDRVRGSQLRVGVAPAPPWTSGTTSADVEGVEVDVVQGFAESLGAEPEFEVGGAERLAEDLHTGRLDLVVGGFTDKVPFPQVALTRPYVAVITPDGVVERHVMAVRGGENALLVALERYLHSQESAVAARVDGGLP